MTFSKRAFDVFFAVVLGLLLSPIILRLIFKIRAQKDGPVLYGSTRMRGIDQPFTLWKFRSMRGAGPEEQGVTGADKSDRITPLGAHMRAKRLDELPQLWNVFKGDISFVGPRPPLPEYVERFPDVYGPVLKSRPGITGMASLIYHRHEEILLMQCADAADTEEVYVRRCSPGKARLEMLYQETYTYWLDWWIIWHTVAKIAPLPTRRIEERRRAARRAARAQVAVH
jgi:lipopolysaccharide/colanic/teichoic acid biosynthesis glycosyltransferase